MFRGGRTEYIRSPTNQTLKFVLAFDDPSVSVRNMFVCGCFNAYPLLLGVCFTFVYVLQREAKLQLFREAVDAHTALTDQVTDIKLTGL